jgi:hypothetical protein
MAELTKFRINGADYDLKDETARQNSGGNVDLSITGASVGQTVRIAEVDENGVPTAWLPADFPSGGGSGGGDVWELIHTANVAEDVSSLVIDKDVNGNSLTLKKVFIVFLGAPTPSNDLYRCQLKDATGKDLSYMDITLDANRQMSITHYADVFESTACKYYDRMLMESTRANGMTRLIGTGFKLKGNTYDANLNETISSINFTYWSTVKAGTDIYVYGVRA